MRQLTRKRGAELPDAARAARKTRPAGTSTDACETPHVTVHLAAGTAPEVERAQLATLAPSTAAFGAPSGSLANAAPVAPTQRQTEALREIAPTLAAASQARLAEFAAHSAVQLIASGHSAESLRVACRVKMVLGQLDEAAVVLDGLIALQPDVQAHRLDLARLHMMRGNPKQALIPAVQAWRHAPCDDSAESVILAQAFLHTGDTRRALGVLSEDSVKERRIEYDVDGQLGFLMVHPAGGRTRIPPTAATLATMAMVCKARGEQDRYDRSLSQLIRSFGAHSFWVFLVKAFADDVTGAYDAAIGALQDFDAQSLSLDNWLEYAWMLRSPGLQSQDGDSRMQLVRAALAQDAMQASAIALTVECPPAVQALQHDPHPELYDRDSGPDSP